MTPIGKLVVAGAGLIGGSLALALREAGAVTSVIGVGRSRANLDHAKARGIADRVYLLEDDWQRELADADVVLVATPIAQFASLFAAIAPHLGGTAVVTDAGSTKQGVIATAHEAFGASFERFVPSHPIAGSDRSGAEAADATLYQGRSVVLTPTAQTSANAVERIEAMWLHAGARVKFLDAATHDRIFAAVSHLPHVLAHTLVAELSSRPDAESLLAHAGPGFRDFTRIAASSPEMWRDVALANREALLAEIAAFRTALDGVARALAAGDGAALQALFARSRDARRQFEALADRRDRAPERR